MRDAGDGVGIQVPGAMVGGDGSFQFAAITAGLHKTREQVRVVPPGTRAFQQSQHRRQRATLVAFDLGV